MPVRSKQNAYRGINAHLNSYLQNAPGNWWQTFHNKHIAHIGDLLDSVLPPGYYAINEKSLQLIEGELALSRITVRPDVSIYKSKQTEPASQTPHTVSMPVATIPLTETLRDEDYYRSVVIKRLDDDNETLAGGINLVEIDYLHQTLSPLRMLPSYPDREDNAYPYLILVSNPHPSLDAGKMDV